MSTFFYDEQIRRYILQFLRIFSDYSIEIPPDENGIRVQKRIPIRYGDMQRQVAQILKENSENVTLSAPAMSGYITDISIANDRRQDPMNVNPIRAMERVYNKETGLYESELGNRYTIERYMPVPYNLTMNLDIWTTNTTDKLQLWEQVLVVFNPSVQLQINDNPLDWSSITEIELINTNWSSRGVPQGSESANDFSTFTFKVPIWINSPTKVKRQTIIEQIITSIYDVDISDVDTDIFDPLRSVFSELDQTIVSPGNYRIDVSAIDATTSRIELLNEYGKSDSTLSWQSLFAAYGTIDPATTTLTLKSNDDIETTSGDVLGSLEVSSTEQNIAIFVVDQDTLPNTIGSGSITNIINPSVSFPGGELPAAAAGQRYLLLTNDQNYNNEPLIAQNAEGNNPWGSITAFENDIIEYNGTDWFVSFDSGTVTTPQYVVNIADLQHYKFDDDEWIFTYLGTFNPGFWRISTSPVSIEIEPVPQQVDAPTARTSTSRSSIYDEQIRRYILQFLRIFADYKIETPADENNIRAQKRIPIRYGDMQRQVAQILKENSENVTLSAPAFSGYITDISLANDRRQDPMNVNPVRAIERVYNKETGLYEAELGNRYTIERYMPVPYTLTMNLDLWTTNTTDKMQLWEQILVVFNSSVQLQTNDNPLDWGSITEIELTDMNWSSRNVPQGSTSINDFSTFTFKVPIWISPPAKVKRQSIIEQIITSIYDVDISDIDTDIFDPLRSAFSPLEQVIVSPGNYRIDVNAIDATTSRIELLDEYGKSDSALSWQSLFAAYSAINPITTTLILKSGDDIESTSGDILGSLEVSSSEQNIATFVVDQDTLPTTIGSGAVTDIINPSVSFPGGLLPIAAAGQRYLLLTNDQDGDGESLIAQNAEENNPWGSIIAFENDIIEYNGTDWFISFNGNIVSAPQYVVNIADSQHYKFDGDEWIFTYLGTFNPGFWRVSLTSELAPVQISEII